MLLSAGDDRTKYHGSCGLDNRNISYNSGGWKSEVRVTVQLGSGENALFFFFFSEVHLFAVSFHRRDKERELLFLLNRTLILLDQGSTIRTSFIHSHSYKGHIFKHNHPGRLSL